MMRRLTYADPAKIDIGCKTFIKEGYTGIDILDYGQHVMWDVREGIPFANNTITDVYCNNFLEHLEDKDIDVFFTELCRICKHDASIEIGVPHSESMGAYTHSHFSLWNELRFEGIVRGFPTTWLKIEKMYRKQQGYYEEIRVHLKVNKV